MISMIRIIALSAVLVVATPVLAQTDTTTAPAAATPPPEAAAPSAPAAPAAATAPAAPAAVGSVPPPPAGKGQIVFFRPSSFVGMAVYFKIRENEAELGKLSNGAYFVQVTDPGKHTFTAKTENTSKLTLEIDDGETYYVKGGLSMGLIVAEANIAPSDQATFEKALKHMHPAAPLAASKPADATPAPAK